VSRQQTSAVVSIVLVVGLLGLVAAAMLTLGGPRLMSEPVSAVPDWSAQAVLNMGAPINTAWDEGELSFADDGTWC